MHFPGKFMSEDTEDKKSFCDRNPTLKSTQEVFHIDNCFCILDEYIDSYSLLRWSQRVLNNSSYRNVHIIDLTASWRSGLALCALIHYFKPDLM